MVMTTTKWKGNTCSNCGESLDVHDCWKCEEEFGEDEQIICIPHSHIDSEHYHIDCHKHKLTEV
jgi:predicted amidophosphoribosyltransferase